MYSIALLGEQLLAQIVVRDVEGSSTNVIVLGALSVRLFCCILLTHT